MIRGRRVSWVDVRPAVDGLGGLKMHHLSDPQTGSVRATSITRAHGKGTSAETRRTSSPNQYLALSAADAHGFVTGALADAAADDLENTERRR